MGPTHPTTPEAVVLLEFNPCPHRMCFASIVYPSSFISSCNASQRLHPFFVVHPELWFLVVHGMAVAPGGLWGGVDNSWRENLAMIKACVAALLFSYKLCILCKDTDALLHVISLVDWLNHVNLSPPPPPPPPSSSLLGFRIKAGADIVLNIKDCIVMCRRHSTAEQHQGTMGAVALPGCRQVSQL